MLNRVDGFHTQIAVVPGIRNLRMLAPAYFL